MDAGLPKGEQHPISVGVLPNFNRVQFGWRCIKTSAASNLDEGASQMNGGASKCLQHPSASKCLQHPIWMEANPLWMEVHHNPNSIHFGWRCIQSATELKRHRPPKGDTRTHEFINSGISLTFVSLSLQY